MINALDESIRKLVLTRGNFDADSVVVSFDQPTGTWAAGLTRPTINFYLYDIRENLDLRSNEWFVEHNETNGQVRKKLAPMRFDLSYLVTVWTQNQVEDEHAILWRVLAALISAPTLPEEILEPPLRSQPYPIMTRTAQPSHAIENLPDLWGVMENQLRPSINYVVTLAMERDIVFTSPWVLTRRLTVTPQGGSEKENCEIGGIVHYQLTGEAIPGATVTLLEKGYSVITDRFGRYRFSNLCTGEYHLRVAIADQAFDFTITVPSRTVTDYDLIIQNHLERRGRA